RKREKRQDQVIGINRNERSQSPKYAAGSSLRSGNKYTLGKLIKNGVMDAKALFIDNYNKHDENMEQATVHFNKIRSLAIKHAEKLKADIEAYEHQQYRYLLFSFARSQEAAMEAEVEYWFEYAKIRSTRDRAVVRAIYECEKAIYHASGTMSKMFYHLIITLLEYSLINRCKLTIAPNTINHQTPIYCQSA
ncbi:hypothetical protein P3732_22800, partial [Vibrio parahaemolyticus]|nr:hypothetical protein [Vibrio parahaemolyticus]